MKNSYENSFKLGLKPDDMTRLKDMSLLSGKSVSSLVSQLVNDAQNNKKLKNEKLEYITLGIDEKTFLSIDKLSKQYKLSRIETLRQLIKQFIGK